MRNKKHIIVFDIPNGNEIPHSVRNDAPRGTDKKAFSGGAAAAESPPSSHQRARHPERSEAN